MMYSNKHNVILIWIYICNASALPEKPVQLARTKNSMSIDRFWH